MEDSSPGDGDSSPGDERQFTRWWETVHQVVEDSTPGDEKATPVPFKMDLVLG